MEGRLKSGEVMVVLSGAPNAMRTLLLTEQRLYSLLPALVAGN